MFLSSDEIFNRHLKEIDNFPNLTEELETTGNITKFYTKTQAFQEIERNIIEKQLSVKLSTQSLLRQYHNAADITKKSAESSKELMKMSIEDVIMILEKSQNIKINTFEDVLKYMKNVQGGDIEKAGFDSKSSENADEWDGDGDEDMFPEGPLFTPQPGFAKPFPFKVGSTVKSHIFPSAQEMVQTVQSKTTPSVYRFGESQIAPPSTSKAARLVKPGEIVYSMSGSPLMVPRLGGLGNVQFSNAEKIPIKDEDGRSIADVFLLPGDQDKRREFQSFATDIRGIAATKSIKKNRIQPSRVASKSKKADWKN